MWEEDEEEVEGEEEQYCGEGADGGAGKSWDSGAELIESFVVWRVVVDLLLDML